MFHWIDARDRLVCLVCLETGAEVKVKAGDNDKFLLVYVKPDVTVDVSYSTPSHANEVILAEYDEIGDAISALGKLGDYLQAYKL